MKLDLKIWRQSNSESEGSLHNYEIDEITPDMSFLEMMDVLNEKLILEGVDPIAFDHDLLMEERMDQIQVLRLVSFICENLKMEIL
jgi:succinate dehydrogenase/fumarate reductase-like Fe-S protein